MISSITFIFLCGFPLGTSYSGCMLHGPGVNFSSSVTNAHPVLFGPCPLMSGPCSQNDVLVRTPTDHCLHEPCMQKGLCVSKSDTYEVMWTKSTIYFYSRCYFHNTTQEIMIANNSIYRVATFCLTKYRYSKWHFTFNFNILWCEEMSVHVHTQFRLSFSDDRDKINAGWNYDNYFTLLMGTIWFHTLLWQALEY